jgi:hypothetical protein
MELEKARQYFEARATALRDMCASGDPFVFLCGTAVIEYLSKLAVGSDGKRAGFKQFIVDYMPEGYRNFTYRSGDRDLPLQMYHILRCGIIHSFSFKADGRAEDAGGRDHSIGLSHNLSEGHLVNFSKGKALDACCLNADEFVNDIRTGMTKLFNAAANSRPTQENVEKWLQQHPPIEWIPD